ncbi:Hypothetical predicted protein [Pelobates cultripes]|uniref:Uncharacterized protein n=1 Tax=Pelobates cultripes TaxID=61616 RepID=A0AAD1WE71_PELCU|nr:Hypothetical predicted protein [Pelobates cultripes]
MVLNPEEAILDVAVSMLEVAVAILVVAVVTCTVVDILGAGDGGKDPPGRCSQPCAEDLDGERDLMPPIPSSVSWLLLYTSDQAALIIARKRLSASVKPLAGDCPWPSERAECQEGTEPPSDVAAFAAAIPPL